MGPDPSAVCHRASRCLNFRLRRRPCCDQCGVAITMNHFHHTREHYRICHDCFERHLAAIGAGAYRPATRIQGELRECAHHERCFRDGPYSLYQPKICDACGRLFPPEHYHDIHANTRRCLPCYLARPRVGRPPGDRP